MGRVMDKCCCPAARAGQTAKHGPDVTKVKAPNCCQLLERSGHDGIPALREGAMRVPAPELATAAQVVVVVLEPELLLLPAEVAQARAPPPRPGPPLFLKNCSLLT